MTMQIQMPTTTQRAERRTFQMHRNLLRDVIEKQAGTLDKAVLEAAMNLVEAGATRGEVELRKERVIIRDDGRGFRTKAEIVAAFEMFGKSDERRKEEKRYARYQMGRGQLFAFGKTTYRTRTFRMTVDIRGNDEMEYDLVDNLPDMRGCEIAVELYEPLDTHEMRTIAADIATSIEYMDVPISLNDKIVTKNPNGQSWSYETADAWVRLEIGKSSIAIYNQGVFVQNSYEYGVGGVVVSKRRLDVNLARNQVMSGCPVWNRIKRRFAKEITSELMELDRFSGQQARSVVVLASSGSGDKKRIARLKMLLDTNGRRRSLSSLRGKRVAFDDAGSILADKAMQQNPRVVVLDAQHARAMHGCNPGSEAHYFNWCWQDIDDSLAIEEIDRKTLYSELDTKHKDLPDPATDTPLGAALEALRAINEDPRLRLREQADQRERNEEDQAGNDMPTRRRIGLGRADGMLAWTDGCGAIAFEERFLGDRCGSIDGWIDILLTLAHEYAHRGSERTHDGDFHERYHDTSWTFARLAGDALEMCLQRNRTDAATAGTDEKSNPGDVAETNGRSERSRETAERTGRARALRSEGVRIKDIARELGVGERAIVRYCRTTTRDWDKRNNDTSR